MDAIDQIINDIRKVVEVNDFVFVHPDLTWNYGCDGCQPSGTFAIYGGDVLTLTHDEIAVEMEEWLEHVNNGGQRQ